jgi:SAM-dependent methyltransferase
LGILKAITCSRYRLHMPLALPTNWVAEWDFEIETVSAVRKTACMTTPTDGKVRDVRCPSCSKAKIVFVGPSIFAGWAETEYVAALRQSSGGLYRCLNCGLAFRNPVPSRDELIAAYKSIPSEQWEYSEPARWAWLRTCISEYAPNNRVLDVGCFRADFLRTLPRGYECFGIEPNLEAAEIARSRGVTIIGAEAMEELQCAEGLFGAIVIMDVAEHLPDPAAAFRHLGKYLAPRGILLVLTGNADHWLARWSLPFYWYMIFPIHLAYLSTTYFNWFARNEGWVIIKRLYFSHQDHGRWRRFREMEIGLRVMVWKRWLEGSGLGRLFGRTRLFRGIAAMKTPPFAFCVPDHVGVVLILRTDN